MNKGLIIGIVVVLILIAGGLYAFRGTAPAAVETEPEATETTDEEYAPESATSLKGLLASSVPQQCTFKDSSDPATVSEGKVYVAQKKMRGDFSSMVSGQTQKSHIIIDGQKTYIWIDGQTQGLVASLDVADKSPEGSASNQVDLDKQVDIDCQPWIADTALFTVPTDVQFTDFSSLSAPAGNTPSSSSETQCAACNSLPPESQAQCRATLGCI